MEICSFSASLDAQLLLRYREEAPLFRLGYHGRSRVAEPHDYGIEKVIERAARLSAACTWSDPSGRSAQGWRLFDVSLRSRPVWCWTRGFPRQSRGKPPTAITWTGT